MNENMPERTKRALDCKRKSSLKLGDVLPFGESEKKMSHGSAKRNKAYQSLMLEVIAHVNIEISLISLSFVFFFRFRSEKRAPYVRLLLLDMNGQAHHKIQMMW